MSKKKGDILERLLNEQEDAVKEAAKKEIEKIAKAKMKKKLKQRRKRFVRCVIVTGALVAGGYYLYKKNDKVKGLVQKGTEAIPAKARVIVFEGIDKLPDKVKVVVQEKAEKIPFLAAKE